MIQILQSVISPLSSVSLFMLSVGFFVTFISLHLKTMGAGEDLIGLVQSAYFAGLFFGAFKSEGLIRRVGHIRALAACACGQAATIMVMALFSKPIVWVLMRFVSGICGATFFIIIESWLLTKSTVETRGGVLSFYMIAFYIGQSLSQFILDIIDITTLEPFIVSSLFCSIAVIPVAITYEASPEPSEPTFDNPMQLFKISPFGTWGCIVSGCILGAIYSFLPLFAATHDLSVSLVMSITIGGGFILQWPVGILSDIYDRRRVLISVCLAVVIPCLLLWLFAYHQTAVLILALILGGLTFTLYPLSISHVCDRVQAEDIVTVTGMLLLFYSIGSTIGPITVANFIRNFGEEALFGYTAFLSLALASIGIYSLFKRPYVPADEQLDYVPLPQQTMPVALELDPRVSEEVYEEASDMEAEPNT